MEVLVVVDIGRPPQLAAAAVGEDGAVVAAVDSSGWVMGWCTPSAVAPPPEKA